jgi:TIR domain
LHKDNQKSKKTMTPIPIFISYSHKDEEFKDALVEQLAPLRRNQMIAPWQDRDLIPGEEWNEAIFEKLKNAKIVLLLVSSSFINSDFCMEKELQAAIDRHKTKECTVVPIIIRPCDFAEMPFAKFQAVPKNAKPITKWENQDEAWLDVVKQLKNLIKNLHNEKK